MGAYSAETDLKTLSQSECQAIREQLSRLLGSPYFAHSKRFPDLLGYVIERTLDGQSEGIKERTLGIEVFGRDANYDTGSDPIVRVAAGEVRKRLAQYYQEVGHEDELRITLPSGSYIPKFRWPECPINVSEQSQQPPSETGQAEETSTGVVEESAALVSATQFGEPNFETQNSCGSSDPFLSRPSLPSERWKARHFGSILIASGVITLLLLGGTFFVWRATHRSAFSFFWGPVLAGSDPVLICVPEQFHGPDIPLHDTSDPDGQHSFSDASKQADFATVTTDDLDAVVKMTGILRSHGRQFSIKSDEASLADLKLGPTIFVGALDNLWTLRLTNSLRFHFLNNPDSRPPRIVDQTAPAGSGWVMRTTSTGSYRDYAIVARFTDSDTGKPTVVVAGLGRCGTQAAGQFVSDPDALDQVERSSLAAGEKKNIEVVLSTRVIDGHPGSPKIEAVYFW